MRLDEEKLEALRSWGERLRKTGGEESAAVGRAILMLVEEIDRLHIDLWHARMAPSAEEPARTPQPAEAEEQPVASSLQARLQRILGRDTSSEAKGAEQPGTSPEAWIEGLRRQK